MTTVVDNIVIAAANLQRSVAFQGKVAVTVKPKTHQNASTGHHSIDLAESRLELKTSYGKRSINQQS